MKLTLTNNKKFKLGNLFYTFDKPWKVSAVDEIGDNIVVMPYNNVTRRNSQLMIYNVKTKEAQTFNFDGAETLGHPLQIGGYVVSAGECDHLVYSLNGSTPQKHTAFKLGWATKCIEFNGQALVLDYDYRRNPRPKNFNARDCLTGKTVFSMKGAYIPFDAVVHEGKLYAAVGWDQGLSCNDGRFWSAPMCHCVTSFRGGLYFTSKNKILTINNDWTETVMELPCEKIMHMRNFNDEYVHITGANPDTLWRVEPTGEIQTIGQITTDLVKVGGGAFGWCSSKNYFIRTVNSHEKASNGRGMDFGEVYPIITR